MNAIERAQDESMSNSNKLEQALRLVKVQPRILALGLGGIYYALLLVCYISIIAATPAYAAQGMGVRPLSALYWTTGIMLGLIPLLWLPISFQRPSAYTSWILYLCVIAPGAMFPFLISSREPANVLPLPITLVGSFALFEAFRRQRPFRIPRVKGTMPLYRIGLPLAMLLLTIATFALARFKLDVSFDVYGRRLAAREVIAAVPIMGYAISFLIDVGVPTAMTIAVLWRKWLLLPLAGLSILAAFSLEGTKTTVFAPLFLLLILFIDLLGRKRAGLWLLIAIICVIALALLERYYIRSQVICTYFIRRLLVMPAQLTTYYWEFFSEHPLVLMSDSLLRHVIEPRYSLYTPRLIGYQFFGNAATNANANIWAAGFAQLGYLGIPLASAAAGLILRLADSLAQDERFSFGSIVCGMIGVTWTNSALHTSLLSHGVVALLCALYLYPKLNRYNVCEKWTAFGRLRKKP